MSLVAWQRGLSQTDIVSMMWLHSLEFELVERTRHLARRQGSALLWQVFETLRQTAERTSRPQDQVPPESKLVIYVGHDTNLANIGGMLGVDWQLTTYLRNETPPAGAMAQAVRQDVLLQPEPRPDAERDATDPPQQTAGSGPDCSPLRAS